LNEGILFVPNINSKVYLSDVKPNKIVVKKDELFIGTKDEKIIQSNLKNFNAKVIFEGESKHEVYLLKYDKTNDDIYFTSKNFNRIKSDGSTIFSIGAAVKDFVKIDNSYYAYAMSGAFGFYQISNQKSRWSQMASKKIIKTESIFLSQQIQSIRAK
jgi:hypothetical protein